MEGRATPGPPFRVAELRRHKEVVLKAVSYVLLLLAKYFHRNHPFQAAHFLHLIVDANGILLILKYLNQKDMLPFVACPHREPVADDLLDVQHAPIALLVDADGLRDYILQSSGGLATSRCVEDGPDVHCMS